MSSRRRRPTGARHLTNAARATGRSPTRYRVRRTPAPVRRAGYGYLTLTRLATQLTDQLMHLAQARRTIGSPLAISPRRC